MYWYRHDSYHWAALSSVNWNKHYTSYNVYAVLHYGPSLTLLFVYKVNDVFDQTSSLYLHVHVYVVLHMVYSSLYLDSPYRSFKTTVTDWLSTYHSYWCACMHIGCQQKYDFRLLYLSGKQKQNYDHETIKGSLLDNFSGKNLVLPMFQLDALVLFTVMKPSCGADLL